MQVKLEIIYDLQTHSVRFGYSLPGLFKEKRDILYAMLCRANEEVMRNIIGGISHDVIEDAPSGPFGKGKKTDVT